MEKLKKFLKLGLAAVGVLAVLAVMFPQLAVEAQQVGSQTLISMKFIKAGVQAQGSGVLQTGEVNTLSAAVASATTAQVVAAPSAGSIYLRGILVEKSTGGTGTFTVIYGTGTNCGTGTTTLLGPVTNPQIGVTRLGVLLPATKALCLATDASTTGVRALTN